jgi:hypothetical protein
MAAPREEDRAAELARQLNEAGIKADPGVLGGVVIYATPGQAQLFLAGLVPVSADQERDDRRERAAREHEGNRRMRTNEGQS